MVKHMEITAKTVEEAIARASAETGIEAEKLKYVVKEEPKRGFLGIGSEDAVIDVTYELAPVESAKEFLETFLKNAGFENASITETVVDDEETKLEIVGENLGLIIGRHGDTLDSLQYLANLAANRHNRGFQRISVDVEKYRAKRVDTLCALAVRTATRVKKGGRSVTLDPMNAYERRIIHARLQKYDGITTYSIGTGEGRRVVVALEGEKKITDKEPVKFIPNDRKPRSAEQKKSDSVKTADSDKPAVKYEYNPVREPKHIVKAKSIDELNLADVEDTETVILN